MNILRSLFTSHSKVDLSQLLKQGAIVVDVRTKAEFAQGHVTGSINIPLDTLSQRMRELHKERSVITCCRSGMRSGQALQMLKAEGFDVHNGGPWTTVDNLRAQQ